MELLPSRAPLCFRLRGKGTKSSLMHQISVDKYSLQFELYASFYAITTFLSVSCCQRLLTVARYAFEDATNNLLETNITLT